MCRLDNVAHVLLGCLGCEPASLTLHPLAGRTDLYRCQTPVIPAPFKAEAVGSQVPAYAGQIDKTRLKNRNGFGM